MTRCLFRVVAWTIGWTLYQWWAVIGWPSTVDEDHLVLMIACAGSSLGFTGWYALSRTVLRAARPIQELGG
jgi:hypothetical protein